MSTCYITISYYIFFSLICSADLFSIVFNLTFFQIDRIRSIILLSNVSHINEWFVSICPSVCLFICLSVWASFCFLFCSLLISLLFLIVSLSYLFSIFWFLFFHGRIFAHLHAHTLTWTLTYIWIYVPSYDLDILLQKMVSEES